MNKAILSLFIVSLISSCSTTPSSPRSDIFSNQKDVLCTSFSDDDDLLTYMTGLAIIEIRKADLVKLLQDVLEGDPPKADSIRSQLMDLEDCTNLEKLDFPLLYYIRNAMTHLMKGGQCQVYDRKTERYVKSIVVADWNGYVAGGIGFLLKDSDVAFFKNREWII